MSRRISDSERDYVFNLVKEDGVTVKTISTLFLQKGTNPAMFDVDDFFELPIGQCLNTRAGDTTIGIYLFNEFIIKPCFKDLIGYQNTPITGKVFGHLESLIADALYTDKISTSIMADYYNRCQWLGGNPASNLLAPSFTLKMLTSPPSLDEMLETLKKKYADLIKDNPAVAGAKIEAELIEMAKLYLNEDLDSAENFASATNISIENNYKKMNLIVGPLQNSGNGEYTIVYSNYNRGISKADYAVTSDSSVMGAYARSTSVAVGGYMAKKSHVTLNTVVADKHGTDCGTTENLLIYLYPSLKKEYMYRYVVDGKNLILLTPNNIGDYLDTFVKLRSPMFCKTKDYKYCSKCIGEQPYMLGLTKFGLAIARLSNTLLNLQLKKFHDLTVKVHDIDKDDLLHWIN